MIRVLKATPMEDYKLLITFTNGEEKVFDMEPKLKYPAFKELKDKNLFNLVKVNFGTIEWADKIDYCPDSLYQDSIPLC